MTQRSVDQSFGKRSWRTRFLLTAALCAALVTILPSTVSAQVRAGSLPPGVQSWTSLIAQVGGTAAGAPGQVSMADAQAVAPLPGSRLKGLEPLVLRWANPGPPVAEWEVQLTGAGRFVADPAMSPVSTAVVRDMAWQMPAL